MKLNIPINKRLRQLFCRHKIVGWVHCSKGINNKKGYEYVIYECADCGLSVGKWFIEGEWMNLNFPDEHTL